MKVAQLQIRISAQDKAAIRRAAKQAGIDMSTYVLDRVLPPPAARFRECVQECAGATSPGFALAELNSLLASFTTAELREAVGAPPTSALTPFLANYIAAMVEYACEKHSIAMPTWIRGVAPLVEPVFGTTLQSLRLYLLTHSPPPFRRRNIFIDATVGDRV